MSLLSVHFSGGEIFSVSPFIYQEIIKECMKKKSSIHLNLIKENDFFVCINEDQWEHHFETRQLSSSS